METAVTLLFLALFFGAVSVYVRTVLVGGNLRGRKSAGAQVRAPGQEA